MEVVSEKWSMNIWNKSCVNWIWPYTWQANVMLLFSPWGSALVAIWFLALSSGLLTQNMNAWLYEEEAKLFLALMDFVSHLNQSSNPYLGSCCNAFLYKAKTVYSLSTWTCGNYVLWGTIVPCVKCLMSLQLFQSCLNNRLLTTMGALCNTFWTLVCLCLSLEYLITHTESKTLIDLTFESNNVTWFNIWEQ